MKKLSIVLALTAVLVFAFVGGAFANFGPHGGYAQDTDACAGCHRAHTSFSSLTWQDAGLNDHSALLISGATTMQEFCYACHGSAAPGASTNVVDGIFDSGPSGAAGVPLGGAIAYQTNSVFNGVLNGGGFSFTPTQTAGPAAASTSMHQMEKGTATDPMWGAGTSAPTGANLTCTGCHDPHGSSNYRLLKDTVNGVPVGGYTGATGEIPQAFVFSNEVGYPTVASGGWLKHEPGAAQMVPYRPNYTTTQLKYAGTSAYSGGDIRSISTWCAACHTQYAVKTSAYNYQGYTSDGTTRTTAPSAYNFSAVAGFGAANNLTPGAPAVTQTFHRHPVDTTLVAVTTANGWGSETITSTMLPLEARPGAAVAADWTRQDYMGCLTCHRAHGTSATETGWAAAANTSNGTTTTPVRQTNPLIAGVNPNFTSSLLRADNRGVCERCHNK